MENRRYRPSFKGKYQNLTMTFTVQLYSFSLIYYHFDLSNRKVLFKKIDARRQKNVKIPWRISKF